MPGDRTSDPKSGVRVIELEITIRAPLARVWKALVHETGRWWRREFFTSDVAKTFVIEPVLGGKMYEDWGGGAGVVWATVTAVKSPTMLELAGVASPAWGGPRTHYHSFRLSHQNGVTTLRFTDAMHGRVDAATETSLREGWLLLLNEGLREHCEAKKR
jgi:uncharacterized protein YndB with AHSA1/START domain